MADEEKRKKASLNNSGYVFNVVANNNRLEQGKATSNVNFHVLSQTVEECHQAREQARRELDGN